MLGKTLIPKEKKVVNYHEVHVIRLVHIKPNSIDGNEASTSLAKIVFILKFLTEILLMYASFVHILLRRDAEISSCKGAQQKGPAGVHMGGVFHHILHKFLLYSRSSKKDKKIDGD